MLIDYGPIGTAEKFEAWSTADAMTRFARETSTAVGDAASASIADRPAIAALAELFQSVDARRGAAAALRGPTRQAWNLRFSCWQGWRACRGSFQSPERR